MSVSGLPDLRLCGPLPLQAEAPPPLSNRYSERWNKPGAKRTEEATTQHELCRALNGAIDRLSKAQQSFHALHDRDGRDWWDCLHDACRRTRAEISGLEFVAMPLNGGNRFKFPLFVKEGE